MHMHNGSKNVPEQITSSLFSVVKDCNSVTSSYHICNTLRLVESFTPVRLCIKDPTLLSFSVQVAALTVAGCNPWVLSADSRGHCTDYTRDSVTTLGTMPNIRATNSREGKH